VSFGYELEKRVIDGMMYCEAVEATYMNVHSKSTPRVSEAGHFRDNAHSLLITKEMFQPFRDALTAQPLYTLDVHGPPHKTEHQLYCTLLTTGSPPFNLAGVHPNIDSYCTPRNRFFVARPGVLLLAPAKACRYGPVSPSDCRHITPQSGSAKRHSHT